MSDAWERAVQALGQAKHWGGRLQGAHADLEARERRITILVAQVEKRLGHPVESGFSASSTDDPAALLTELDGRLADAVALDEAIVARDHLANLLGRAAVGDDLRAWQRAAATSLARAESALLEGSNAGVNEARTIFASQSASLRELETRTHAAARDACVATDAAEASYAEVGEIVQDEVRRLAQGVSRLLRARSGIDTAGAIGMVAGALVGAGVGAAVGNSLGEGGPGAVGVGGLGLALGLLGAIVLWAARSRPFAAELGVHATRAGELVEEVRHARKEVVAELDRVAQAAAVTRLAALDLGLSAELPEFDRTRAHVEAPGLEAEATALGDEIAGAGRWSANLKVGAVVGVVVAGLGLGALAATVGPVETAEPVAERPVEVRRDPTPPPVADPAAEAGAVADVEPNAGSDTTGSAGATDPPAATPPPAPARPAEPVWPFKAGNWKGTYGLGELSGPLEAQGASVRGTLTMTEGGTAEPCKASGTIASGGKITLRLSGCAAAGTIKAKIAPDGSALIGSGSRKTPLGTVTDNLTLTAG